VGDQDPAPPSRFRNYLELTKDSATLLREAVIVFLIFGLFFWTGQFKSVAQRLGITEMDFGGLKVELRDSRTAMESAAAQAAILQSQALDLDSQLQKLQKTAKGTKLADQVDLL
jgi:hypothetical protein